MKIRYKQIVLGIILILFMPIFAVIAFLMGSFGISVFNGTSLSIYGYCPHYEIGDRSFMPLNGEGLLLPTKMIKECVTQDVPSPYHQSSSDDQRYILLSGELADYRRLLPIDVRDSIEAPIGNDELGSTEIYIEFVPRNEFGPNRPINEIWCDLSYSEYSKSCWAGYHFYGKGVAAQYYFVINRNILENKFHPVMNYFLSSIDQKNY